MYNAILADYDSRVLVKRLGLRDYIDEPSCLQQQVGDGGVPIYRAICGFYLHRHVFHSLSESLDTMIAVAARR